MTRSPKEEMLAVGLIAGIFIGWILAVIGGRFSYFTLDSKISVVELTTLLLTGYAALVLYRSAERVKYADQLRKDTLIRLIQSMRTTSDRCAALVAIGSKPHNNEVSAALKLLRSEMKQFKDMLKLLKIHVSSDVVTAAHDAINLQYRLMTATPPGPARADAPLRVENELVIVNRERRLAIESQHGEIAKRLLAIEADVISFA